MSKKQQAADNGIVKTHESWIQILGEVLTEQMNHWMIFPVLLTIRGALSTFTKVTTPGVEMWAFMAILPLLTFLIRWKVKNFAVFCITNLAIIGVGVGISFTEDHVFYKFLCIAGAVVYMGMSLMIRVKKNEIFSPSIKPVFPIVVTIVGLFVLNVSRSKIKDELIPYYLFTLIGCFALYFIIYYITHFLKFVQLNANGSDAVPTKEIFGSGAGYVLGYTVFGTAVLVFATNLPWLEKVVQFFADFILAPLSALMKMIFGEDELVKEYEDVDFVIPVPPQVAQALGMTDGESSGFWNVFQTVIIIVFAIVATFLIVKLLMWLYRILRENFDPNYKKKELNGDELDGVDIREKIKIGKEDEEKRERGLFGILSNNEKIRRLYKKRLLREAATLVDGKEEKLGFFTARESEAKLNVEGLAMIYEKARYSGENVSSDDVRAMKEVCK